MEGEMLDVPMILLLLELGICKMLLEIRKAEWLFQVDLDLEQ